MRRSGLQPPGYPSLLDAKTGVCAVYIQLGLMKSTSGEPRVEVLEALETDSGFRLVCRFDEAYMDPVAPGALYDRPDSADAQFLVHKLVEQSGLIYTFETFERGVKPPPVGRQFYYRGWWVRAAMQAALDVSARWERKAYPDNGSHDHCLFSWEAIGANEPHKVAYFSEVHGWITEQAYVDFIARDFYFLRQKR